MEFDDTAGESLQLRTRPEKLGYQGKDDFKVSAQVSDRFKYEEFDDCHQTKEGDQRKGGNRTIATHVSCQSPVADDHATQNEMDESKSLVPQISVHTKSYTEENGFEIDANEHDEKMENIPVFPRFSFQAESQASEEYHLMKPLSEDKLYKRRNEKIVVPQLSIQSQDSEEGHETISPEDKILKRRNDKRIFNPQLSVQSQGSGEGHHTKASEDKTLKRRDETRIFVPQLSVQSQYSTKKLHLFFAGVVTLVVISVMFIVLIIVIKAVIFPYNSGDDDLDKNQMLTTESVTYIEYKVTDTTDESS